MSVLSSHAQESRQRVEQLRVVLADRKADPKVYENLQRERWMHEKRQLIVSAETEVVLQYLDVLRKSSNDDTRIPCQYIPDLPAPTLSPQARRDTNLLMFLASAQTQIPIRTCRPASISFEHTLKRRTMDKVTPMRLRSSSTTLASIRSIKGNSRFRSLDGTKLAWQSRSQSFNGFGPLTSMPLPRVAAALDVVAEDPRCSVDELSDFTSTDTLSSHAPLFETQLSTPLTTASVDLPHVLKPLTLNPEPDAQDDQGGTATIYKVVPHYPFDHLLANLHVSLPDYALELFSHFDQSEMAALRPISLSSAPPCISRPFSPPSFVPPLRPVRNTSSILQVPPSTPSKPSNLPREPLYKNLFAMPEAFPSRNRVEDGSGLDLPIDGLLSRSRKPQALPNYSSTGSLNFSVTENVTKKIKKRWSVLWRS